MTASRGEREGRRAALYDDRPHRLSVLTMLGVIPGFFQQWTRVPSSYFAAEVGQEGDQQVRLARVTCPCGEEPLVEAGQIAECSCERFFFYAGGRVYAANSPKDRVEPETMPEET